MRPIALAAALAVALLLYADRIQAATPTPWNEVEPPEATCTIAEINALGLKLGVPTYDGWYAVTELQLAARRACAKVPARWRWVNRSFLQSTRLVDRLYPGMGHGSWAYRCASSEGGHGLFVMNRKGSGAGGWLQFMSGTFWSVIYGAVERARAHDVRIPDYALTWTSPLGQAIAGSEMLFDGRRGEWSGSTC